MIADFPLGKYVGNREGRTEQMPTPARVHASLLCAAAQGPSAVEADGRLWPCEEDRQALAWLESHPPDGVVIPDSAQSHAQEIAYRDMGLLKQKKRGVKSLAKPATRGVAVGGAVAWCWRDAPPEPVQERLKALCRDVPYLGSSESPVRMRIGDLEPTHLADPDASLFDLGGYPIEVAAPGRGAALIERHTTLHSGSPGEAAARADEVEAVPAHVTEAVRLTRYRSTRAPVEPGACPWDRYLLVGFDSDRTINAKDRLAWCVALHRALISVIGYGASPVITGKYDLDAPANHMAVHIVDSSPLVREQHTTNQSFLLLFPHDAQAGAVTQVSDALDRIQTVRGPGSGRGLRLVGSPSFGAASEFWAPPPKGLRRVWIPSPVGIPDTRPIRSAAWNLSDAVALSVALAWRDFVSPKDTTERVGVRRSDLRYVLQSDAARAQGVEVIRATPVNRPDSQRFVHRVAQGTLISPYTATISLGRLGNDGAAAAIGQSRHLGVGLLLPVDVSASVLDALRQQ